MSQGWSQAAFRMHQYAATIVPELSEKAARRRVARLYDTSKVRPCEAAGLAGIFCPLPRLACDGIPAGQEGAESRKESLQTQRLNVSSSRRQLRGQKRFTLY